MSNADDVLAVTDDGPSVPHEAATAVPQAPALPPLAVSALMVTKADLIVALRAYLPHLSDIEPIDGDRFLLKVGEHDPDLPENGAS